MKKFEFNKLDEKSSFTEDYKSQMFKKVCLFAKNFISSEEFMLYKCTQDGSSLEAKFSDFFEKSKPIIDESSGLTITIQEIQELNEGLRSSLTYKKLQYITMNDVDDFHEGLLHSNTLTSNLNDLNRALQALYKPEWMNSFNNILNLVNSGMPQYSVIITATNIKLSV